MRKILVGTAVAVLASALIGSVASAQTEVSVQATRILSTRTVGRTAAGVPIVDISLAYSVSLKDLNLALATGATEAEQRVKDAALGACKEISRNYPDATPNELTCAMIATDKALVKLHQMVA
ncbi:MAG TPA: hypothetical protein VN787_07325, partial [Steroidobacteraceae bacterium]|nr:hypothetical protein [Steroidobacteraceae bacterium]